MEEIHLHKDALTILKSTIDNTIKIYFYILNMIYRHNLQITSSEEKEKEEDKRFKNTILIFESLAEKNNIEQLSLFNYLCLIDEGGKDSIYDFYPNSIIKSYIRYIVIKLLILDEEKKKVIYTHKPLFNENNKFEDTAEFTETLTNFKSMLKVFDLDLKFDSIIPDLFEII